MVNHCTTILFRVCVYVGKFDQRKQHSAATKALRAALGIAHQHQQQQQRQRSARTTSGTAQDGGAAVYRDSESVFDRDRVDDDPGKTTGRRAAAAEEERFEPVHIETGRRSSVQDGPVRSEANRTGPGRTRADRTEVGALSTAAATATAAVGQAIFVSRELSYNID